MLIDPEVIAVNEADLCRKVERCYRICYKSEDKMDLYSAEPFLRRFICSDARNKHWSPLEHARVKVTMSMFDWDVIRAWQEARGTFFLTMKPLDIDRDELHSTVSVTGNFRAWLEFIVGTKDSGCPLQTVSTYVADALADKYPAVFEPFGSGGLASGFYCEGEADDYQTFHIITTRDILQEFARHRSLSFSVESTRYCNYGKRGMMFTKPYPYAWANKIKTFKDVLGAAQYLIDRYEKDTRFYGLIRQMGSCEELFLLSTTVSELIYEQMLSLGVKPQEARMVLPGALKTEMMVTGTLNAWEHFIQLRADKAAHPQMQYIAEKIKALLCEIHPKFKRRLDS